MSWIKTLERKWKVSTKDVFIILLVFACTGFTIMFLKRPVVNFFAPDGNKSFLFSVIYYILILPVYNIFLLIYGFLFGKFSWFWEFEKRFFSRFLGKRTE